MNGSAWAMAADGIDGASPRVIVKRKRDSERSREK